MAAALCGKIYETGIKVDLIVSLTEERGQSLAESCEASWSSVPEFPSSTDIIIVAVPDHRLKSVLENLRCPARYISCPYSWQLRIEGLSGTDNKKGSLLSTSDFFHGSKS